MSKLSIPSSIPRRTSVLAAALLFGAVCAHSIVQLRETLQPASPAPAQAAPIALSGAADAAGLHLFGQSETAVSSAPAAPPPNLRLTGVIASRAAAAAVALLQVDGKPVAAQPGTTIAPGLILREVLRDRVVLVHGGELMELALSTAHDATPPSGASLQTGGLGVPGRAPGAMAGSAPFRLEVQSLGPNHLAFSKAELNRALQDPKQASALGRASAHPGGGLALDEVPGGSLPDKLGMRSGDILRQANGQVLANLTDLPRLYQEFGNAGTVRLEIVRGGQPISLQYTIKP